MSKSPFIFPEKINKILHGGTEKLKIEIKTTPVHNFPGTLNECPIVAQGEIQTSKSWPHPLA